MGIVALGFDLAISSKVGPVLVRLTKGVVSGRVRLSIRKTETPYAVRFPIDELALTITNVRISLPGMFGWAKINPPIFPTKPAWIKALFQELALRVISRPFTLGLILIRRWSETRRRGGPSGSL